MFIYSVKSVHETIKPNFSLVTFVANEMYLSRGKDLIYIKSNKFPLVKGDVIVKFVNTKGMSPWRVSQLGVLLVLS